MFEWILNTNLGNINIKDSNFNMVSYLEVEEVEPGRIRSSPVKLTLSSPIKGMINYYYSNIPITPEVYLGPCQTSTIMVIIFWDFLMFCQVFLSLKWNETLASNKHSICQLSHEFPNDLRFKIFRNRKISGESQNFIEL